MQLLLQQQTIFYITLLKKMYSWQRKRRAGRHYYRFVDDCVYLFKTKRIALSSILNSVSFILYWDASLLTTWQNTVSDPTEPEVILRERQDLQFTVTNSLNLAFYVSCILFENFTLKRLQSIFSVLCLKSIFKIVNSHRVCLTLPIRFSADELSLYGNI